MRAIRTPFLMLEMGMVLVGVLFVGVFRENFWLGAAGSWSRLAGFFCCWLRRRRSMKNGADEGKSPPF
jgi:hypothetical protein